MKSYLVEVINKMNFEKKTIERKNRAKKASKKTCQY